MKLRHGLIPALLVVLLAGCEQLGIEDPAVEKAREEAEGKAIGSGCRQTGRALEDCYQNHRRSPKAAIFAGWRDMDTYMRENKIEDIKPDLPVKAPAGNRPLEGAQNSGEVAPPPKADEAAAKPAAEAAPAQKSRPAFKR